MLNEYSNWSFGSNAKGGRGLCEKPPIESLEHLLPKYNVMGF